jgi:hypothetical protein
MLASSCVTAGLFSQAAFDLAEGDLEFRAVLDTDDQECLMPKLYEYLGLIVLFYSDEHEPIHVHGLFQGRESRADIEVENGKVVRIRFGPVRGRKPLDRRRMADFRALIGTRADEIVEKWVDFFVWHKPVTAERIVRRLR